MAASMTAAILGPMVRAQICVTWKIECRETLTVSLEPMATS
jgi:hypothetical protein